jgi:hypothetical protein
VELYESLRIGDNNDSQRPWKTSNLFCDHNHYIRGCIIADWPANSDGPPLPGTLLQSELLEGTVLLHRVPYTDCPIPTADHCRSPSLTAGLTYHAHPAFGRNRHITLSPSASKTSVSFTLQDVCPIPHRQCGKDHLFATAPVIDFQWPWQVVAATQRGAGPQPTIRVRSCNKGLPLVVLSLLKSFASAYLLLSSTAFSYPFSKSVITGLK